MQSTDVRFEQVFFQAVDGRSCILLCDRRNAPFEIEGRLVVFFCLGRLYTPVTPKIRFTFLEGFKTVCPQKQLALPPPPLSRRQGRRLGHWLGRRPGRRPTHLYTSHCTRNILYIFLEWRRRRQLPFPIIQCNVSFSTFAHFITY